MTDRPAILRATEREIIIDRACLVVARYSWELLRTWLDDRTQECAGKDWGESTQKLQRYFRWEYEDYRL